MDTMKTRHEYLITSFFRSPHSPGLSPQMTCLPKREMSRGRYFDFWFPHLAQGLCDPTPAYLSYCYLMTFSFSFKSLGHTIPKMS